MDFVADAVAADSNARFIKELGFGSEKAPALLRALAPLNEEDKPVMVDFMRRHRKLIDTWTFDERSELMQQRAAEYIFTSRPDLMQRLAKGGRPNNARRSGTEIRDRAVGHRSCGENNERR